MAMASVVVKFCELSVACLSTFSDLHETISHYCCLLATLLNISDGLVLSVCSRNQFHYQKAHNLTRRTDHLKSLPPSPHPYKSSLNALDHVLNI